MFSAAGLKSGQFNRKKLNEIQFYFSDRINVSYEYQPAHKVPSNQLNQPNEPNKLDYPNDPNEHNHLNHLNDLNDPNDPNHLKGSYGHHMR